MSINEVRYLPECGSTNAYMKEHFEEFGPVGAVYTTNQTAGRGRLGRTWVNAEGKALYYKDIITALHLFICRIDFFSILVCHLRRIHYKHSLCLLIYTGQPATGIYALNTYSSTYFICLFIISVS